MSQDFVSITRKIFREWRPHLSPSEFEVVTFILDRTLAYGKSAEVIPMRHFTHGMHSRAGELLHGPIPLGYRQIYRAISTLAAKGCINVNSVGKGAGYRPASYAINALGDPSKGMSRKTQRSVIEDILVCRTVHSNITRDINMKITNGGAARRTSGVLANLQAAVDKGKDARERKADRINATALEVVWRNALAEFWPQARHIAWTRAIQGMVNQKLKAGLADADPKDFFRTLISNWSDFMERLEWVKSPPPSPEIRFACGFIDRLLALREDLQRPQAPKRARVAAKPEAAPSGAPSAAERVLARDLKQAQDQLAQERAQRHEAAGRRLRISAKVRPRPTRAIDPASVGLQPWKEDC